MVSPRHTGQGESRPDLSCSVRLASKLAASVIRTHYYRSPARPQLALEAALPAANHTLYRAAQRRAHLHGMGTTCTALVLWNHVALSAQVGDSRLYLVRNNQIYLMSEDHSAVMEMVRRGALSLADARQHEDKTLSCAHSARNPPCK